MSGQGVEIGTGSDGKIVLRDHATGEVYQYVTHLELVVDPLCRNGEDACPRLKVGVLNIARKADALPVPGGVQQLTITTPVFVEVREGLMRSPKERRKQRRRSAERARTGPPAKRGEERSARPRA